ncbi:hypothetical protein GF352_04495 [archaeon]|nr:hypothetical protein [archaeon]
MIIKVYAWIPRSHVHLAEIVNKIKKGAGEHNLEYGSDLRFTIKKYKGYKDIQFKLDGDGLYSLSINVKEGPVEEPAHKFYNEAKNLFMDLIKKYHRVTHTQIIEGILPINYSTIVLSKKHHPVKDYEKIKAGRYTIYSNKKQAYVNDTFTYISGYKRKDVESICDYLAFTNIASHFFFEMMNKMEQYHNGTKEVIRVLEYEPNNKLINNAYLNLDLVKKDAAESWTKIKQGIDSLDRKEKIFSSNRFTSTMSSLVKGLGVKESFQKLGADKDYLSTLWTLLINHLNYVDTAVEARVNFTNMSVFRNNQWLSIINSGFVLGAIIMALFMIGTGQLNNLYSFVLLVVAWIITYEVINYFVLKRNNN